MKRGDIVSVALQGDFGKPKPAVVVQSDLFSEHATVTVLPVTSTLLEAPLLRLDLESDAENGLKKTSQIMVDKIMTIRRVKVGQRIGAVSEEQLLQISRSLALFLGIV
ncbi:MAG: type II toxin-antitoxin system PemK/MazF family toxin [Chromatiaceae bacterium]|nr:type II toxin-antitoxin system PemK/MazF family toxin [Chromatiaceae bacterium]MCP5441694.1 type II toxin-antitoxin system PemK/MazF family toxin [Chromatiaceae bacterium]